MKNKIALVIVTALGVLLLAAAPGFAMRPCPQEDSPGPCHWNAHAQGNKQGTSSTHYRHHRTVTGEVALNIRQVRRVERIVRRLPQCKAHTNHWTSNCREFVGHRRTLATFNADGLTYYVGLVRGQLDHVEAYR